VFDNGFLTDLRTAAAGALATDLLARPDAAAALLVGAGGQAAFQLEALLGVRELDRIGIWARRPERAQAAAGELSSKHGRRVDPEPDLARAVGRADVIVTVTASRSPLIKADWVAPGTHVTAVGSDLPGKQELESALLGRADVVCVDDPAVTAVSGELQHGLRDGQVSLDGVVTLGAVAAGDAAGRGGAEQITVADLCGLGVQDAAVADVVLRRAGVAAR
jgi:ornithine cyclodeaminase